jgi:hypothetical protein
MEESVLLSVSLNLFFSSFFQVAVVLVVCWMVHGKVYGASEAPKISNFIFC